MWGGEGEEEGEKDCTRMPYLYICFEAFSAERERERREREREREREERERERERERGERERERGESAICLLHK